MEGLPLTKDEIKDFRQTYQEILEDLADCPYFKEMGMEESNAWLQRLLNYNVPGGKQKRGLCVVLAYKMFTEDFNEADLKLSYVLGWLMEMLQAQALIVDDMMDEAETRRGQICWHLLEDVRSKAANDSILISESVYYILRKYFGTHPHYVDLVDTLHVEVFRSSCGQVLDTLSGNHNVDKFSQERFASIVKYKTTCYTLCMPVFTAMSMLGITDKPTKDQVEELLLLIGHLFQSQDDFLDCFADASVLKKPGHDIENGKCAWPIVTALDRADERQRQLIKENYGFHDPEKVKVIQQIYADLKVQEEFWPFQKRMEARIETELKNLTPRLSPKFFLMLCEFFKIKFKN